jgi:hypothetical protein
MQKINITGRQKEKTGETHFSSLLHIFVFFVPVPHLGSKHEIVPKERERFQAKTQTPVIFTMAF